MLGRAHNFKDLTGQTFGRLTAKEQAGVDSQNRTLWSCTCICGTVKTVCGARLRNHTTQSCGCLRNERVRGVISAPDGLSRKVLRKEYLAWQGAKSRCSNPKVKSYKYYGGRGLVVCQHWINSFAQFYRDLGSAPTPFHSLDRRDNDKGYLCPICCPPVGNCRWVTSSVQNKNRRCRPRRPRKSLSLRTCSNMELLQEFQRRGLPVPLSETTTS